MKRSVVALALAALISAVLVGCSYGGVTATSSKQVVVLRNDHFLFGALRKVYVCSVGEMGLGTCHAGEAP